MLVIGYAAIAKQVATSYQDGSFQLDKVLFHSENWLPQLRLECRSYFVCASYHELKKACEPAPEYIPPIPA